MATKLPNGRYRSQVLISTDASRKRQYCSFIADTADEADFLALQYKLTKGKVKPADADRTVRQCVTDYIDVRDGKLSPTTIAGYREKARNSLQSIMDARVDKISNAMLQTAAYEDLKTKSVKTVKEGYHLIKSAITPYVDFEPKVIFPKVKSRARDETHTIPNKSTLALIIRESRGTSLEVPILLASWLSYRASEVCGVKWSDLDKGVLHLTRARVYADKKDHLKDTKTEGSARDHKVPKYIDAALKRHRNDYDSEFIFEPSPHILCRRYRDFVKKIGVPYHSFHDLRHTNASLMLLVMPDKYAQKRGGWKGNTVMKRDYQDTFTPEEIEYGELFDKMFTKDIIKRATRNATRRAKTPAK